MPVLIKPSQTPYGLGIGIDTMDDELYVVSQCCHSVIFYPMFPEIRADEPTTLGVPNGPADVRCSTCRKSYRGFSNPRRPLGPHFESANRWVESWTGLENVTIERDDQ